MKSACVFSIDDAYVMPFQVFFHSLEATSSIPAGTPIFILHTASLSSHSIRELQAFLSRCGRSATFLDASHLIPADLPIRPGDHVSPATFYRLFIAEILPPEIDQAVYLDADMLALRSIAELFSHKVTGLIAASDHCRPADGIRLWGETGGSYFQAGVLVIPVSRWRERHFSNRFLEALNENQENIQWWDQDVLNIAINEKWDRLSIWMNACRDVRLLFPASKVRQEARIIHFCGSRKPWLAVNPGPFAAEWDASYKATFGSTFKRSKLAAPLYTRAWNEVRNRISGLKHGRWAQDAV